MSVKGACVLHNMFMNGIRSGQYATQHVFNADSPKHKLSIELLMKSTVSCEAISSINEAFQRQKIQEIEMVAVVSFTTAP